MSDNSQESQISFGIQTPLKSRSNGCGFMNRFYHAAASFRHLPCAQTRGGTLPHLSVFVIEFRQDCRHRPVTPSLFANHEPMFQDAPIPPAHEEPTLPVIDTPVPNTSASGGNVPHSSESDRSVPNVSESVRNVPQPSESIRTMPHVAETQPASDWRESYTLTVRETARLFETAGVARSERSIVNWCQRNRQGVARLDAYFDPNDRRYFVTRQSVDTVIAEEKAKAARANSEPIPKSSDTFRNQEPSPSEPFRREPISSVGDSRSTENPASREPLSDDLAKENADLLRLA